MTNDYKNVRGAENQPVLFVGDSPSKNVKNVREVLDRNHMIYNSIIIPIIYYTQKFLNKMGYSFPNKIDNEDDIFRYINAIENSEYKKGITADSKEFENLKNEVYKDKNEMIFRYPIIICLGDFSYFAIRCVTKRFNPREKHYYGSSCKYDINRIGQYFNENSKVDSQKDVYILPILHNVSNRIKDLEKLREFIPEGDRNRCVSYQSYIGKKIAQILVDDIIKTRGYENYLKKLK